MTFKINIPADPDIIDTFTAGVSAWKSKEIHDVRNRAFIFRTYSTFVVRWLDRRVTRLGDQPPGLSSGLCKPGETKRDGVWEGMGVPKNPGRCCRDGCGGAFKNGLFSVGICISRCVFQTFTICFVFLLPSHGTLVTLGLNPHKNKNWKYGVNRTLYLKEQ